MHCVFSCFFTIYVFLFKIGQASDSIHWHHRGARGETHALNTTVWQLDGSCARKWADLKCRSNAKSKLPVTCAHKTGWTSLRIQIQHISNQFSENKTLDQPSWQSCKFPEQAGVLHTNHPSQTCYHTNYWKVPDSSTGPSTHHLKELDNGGIPGFLSTMSLSKRNIFFNQLQSPLTSVVAKSNASWVIHLPAFFGRFGPKGSPQAPASGCRPSQRAFRLHVSLL